MFIWDFLHDYIKSVLLHSADDDTWTAINTPVHPFSVTYADGILIITNLQENYMSKDYGKSFKLISNVTGYSYFQNDMWFTLGELGT